MTKRFRPWNPDQKWLLPPEITEFIPMGHVSHFVRDLVVEQLDLGAILDTHDGDRGFPPFHPAMMVALLLYAYIVACDVVATSADCPQLLSMVDRIKANLGRKPRVCSADAGYCSEKNLEGMATRKIKAYIATGRQKHGTKAAIHAKNGQDGSQGPGRVVDGLHCPQPPENGEGRLLKQECSNSGIRTGKQALSSLQRRQGGVRIPFFWERSGRMSGTRINT